MLFRERCRGRPFSFEEGGEAGGLTMAIPPLSYLITECKEPAIRK